jgi:hypothetical protein
VTRGPDAGYPGNIRARIRSSLSIALLALAAGCSHPAVEPVPAYETCELDAKVGLNGTDVTEELGQVKGGAFVAAVAGEDAEIAPWPEGVTGRWYTSAAVRLTLPQDGGPSVCAKIWGSLIADRGVLMTRQAEGSYVAPAVPLDTGLRNTSDFWGALGQERPISASADTVVGGQVFRGHQAPLALVLVNEQGFLSERPPAGPAGGAGTGGGGGMPLFGIWVGVPGTTSIALTPGGSVTVRVQLTGQRAGHTVHLAVTSTLPPGVQLQFVRTDIPAEATDDEAFETIGFMLADASVPVGTRFDLKVTATAGTYTTSAITEVNVFPPPGNP